MKSVQLLLLGVCAIALPSCVAPQPVVISQPATPDYSTPTYKKPAPYCPPTYKKKAPYCPPGMSSNSSSRSNARGAVVDGVFVRDTRPEDVEPARTIGVEVDQ
jgi:hypothetical protein